MRIIPSIALCLFLLWLPWDAMQSQAVPFPLQPGMAVGTCYGFDDPQPGMSPFVIGVMDIRYPPAALTRTGTNWVPPMYHGPSDSWTVQNLGQVFGVTIDDAGNIYTTATTSYGRITFGPGGSGGVYRLDGRTGRISVFARLPQSANYSGLGNICYDRARTQLFVTNFEDGRIYRLSMNGAVLQAFDPLAPDDSAPGFAPLGERTWAVAVYDARLYYSTWGNDGRRESPVPYNTIRSVAIAADGSLDAATDRLEITMPDLEVDFRSNPVATISFSEGGRMLLAERSMYADTLPLAHASRVLEYLGTPGAWGSPRIYLAGFFSGIAPEHANAAGGVDYGYSRVERPGDPVDCDSTVWATGDALRFPNFNPDGGLGLVYGVVGMPASGNSRATIATTSTLVDFDADTANNTKTLVGAVKVMRACNTVSRTGNDTIIICRDTTLVLWAPAGVAYTWEPVPGLSCYDCRTPLVSPSRTTAYVVTTRLASGQLTIDTFTVIVSTERTARFAVQRVVTRSGRIGVPIALETPLDAERIERFTLTMTYDDGFMRRATAVNLVPLGPAAGWRAAVIAENSGSITLEFTAPTPGTYLRGTGNILIPEFLVFLAPQDRAPVQLSVALPPRECLRTESVGDTVTYEICGRSQRLIEAVPIDVTLDGNRPNPFNPSTEIMFTLPETGRARLAVYDNVGRQVALLVDRELSHGPHTVRWDASGFPSGLYYYRLRFGDAAAWSPARAMVLVK